MKILLKFKSLYIFVFLISFGYFTLFADSTYNVQKGDTLYSISRKFQITVAELRAANNLSETDVLKAGQKLVIPEADIGTAAALSSDNNVNKEQSSKNQTQQKTSVYVVQKGDTLYGIARKNGMTVPQLLALNNLDSSVVIKVGQSLKINEGQAVSMQPAKTAAEPVKKEPAEINVNQKAPDTRTYGKIIDSDANTKWPVSKPTVTQVKGKVSGVQLSAKDNEVVKCIHEGTAMYVGVYRGFGQVLFIQTNTGLIYAYTGLGSINVKKGDYVLSGADVGRAGVDSISGKSQITFMVFQNGQPIDPRTAPRN
jgi:LysM repeat protein